MSDESDEISERPAGELRKLTTGAAVIRTIWQWTLETV